MFLLCEFHPDTPEICGFLSMGMLFASEDWGCSWVLVAFVVVAKNMSLTDGWSCGDEPL